MSKYDKAVDAAIRKAIEEGKFENLKGAGEPLNIQANPYVDSGWRTAFDMLEKEGFSLPWMERGTEIENALASARESLAQSWAWREKELAAEKESYWVEQEWQTAENKFRGAVTDLNKQIDDYNLSVPSDIFMRLRINVEREIEKLYED